MKLFTCDSPFRRFIPNRPKAVKPPVIAPPLKTIPELSEEAAGKGRRRLRRTGRESTRITSPGFAQPARTSRAELKEVLG